MDEMNTTQNNPAMKYCPVCGTQIAKSAKACPGCGAKNKKPIFKRGWFIFLVLILAVVAYFKINAALKDFTLTIQTDGSYMDIKASELSELATTDAVAYDKLWGKTVTFTAEVTGTEGRMHYSNISKTYECSLDFGNYVTVGFNQAQSVSVGDTVTIVGTIYYDIAGTVFINGTQIIR